MRIVRLGILNLICAIFFLSSANDLDRAHQFINKLYLNYQHTEQTFVFNGSVADSIFSPELLKLIRLDQTQAKGEAGYLDWDPLCDCQDDEGLKVDSIAISQNADSTYAKIKLHFPSASKTVILKLIQKKGKWLIGNISDASIPDLSEYLRGHLQNVKD
jgi:hypothetical protein